MISESAIKKEWVTIPILPCESIEQTLSFWESLGHVVTYKQTRPYQYGVVQRNGAELHFGKVKGMNPSNNFYNGCLVVVPDAADEYRRISGSLRVALGRVPHSGIPRVSRMKAGATRFTLTDIAGNSIIFVSRGERDQEVWEEANARTGTKLQKAIRIAKRYRDYKNDDVAAGKALDHALKYAIDEDADLAEALVMRMELARHMREQTQEEECRQRLSTLRLDAEVLSRLQQRHETNKEEGESL